MSAEGHHESRNTWWKTPWLNTTSMLICSFMMGPLLVIFWIYVVHNLNYKLVVSAIVVRKQSCTCSKFDGLLNSFLRSDGKKLHNMDLFDLYSSPNMMHIQKIRADCASDSLSSYAGHTPSVCQREHVCYIPWCHNPFPPFAVVIKDKQKLKIPLSVKCSQWYDF